MKQLPATVQHIALNSPAIVVVAKSSLFQRASAQLVVTDHTVKEWSAAILRFRVTDFAKNDWCTAQRVE